jgi:putative ABC transport system permease protein
MLFRKPLIPILVFTQVAIACAILTNVVFQAWQRLSPILASDGVDGRNLIFVDGINNTKQPWSDADLRVAIETLKNVPGVRAASAAYGLPMVSGSLMVLSLIGKSGVKAGVNGYLGEGLVTTLGLDLVSGRDFRDDDYTEWGIGGRTNYPFGGGTQPIIITEALEHKLFVGKSGVGEILKNANDPTDHSYMVVGVVRHLIRNQLRLAVNGQSDNTILMSYRMANTAIVNFAIRTDPKMRDIAMQGVKSVIQNQFGIRNDNDSAPRIEYYEERRSGQLKGYRAALYLFVSVAILVLIVTLIGVMGLTGFLVQTRTRQIGIRRALGARRLDILVLFISENLIIVSLAAGFGMALAYGGNLLLMRVYELPQLPLPYLPVGAFLMIGVGQLAVLGPARRAASVTPLEAVRSRNFTVGST